MNFDLLVECSCVLFVVYIVTEAMKAIAFSRHGLAMKIKELHKLSIYTEELEDKLKELDEYKKRVDALSMKVGFKL